MDSVHHPVVKVATQMYTIWSPTVQTGHSASYVETKRTNGYARRRQPTVDPLVRSSGLSEIRPMNDPIAACLSACRRHNPGQLESAQAVSVYQTGGFRVGQGEFDRTAPVGLSPGRTAFLAFRKERCARASPTVDEYLRDLALGESRLELQPPGDFDRPDPLLVFFAHAASSDLTNAFAVCGKARGQYWCTSSIILLYKRIALGEVRCIVSWSC